MVRGAATGGGASLGDSWSAGGRGSIRIAAYASRLRRRVTRPAWVRSPLRILDRGRFQSLSFRRRRRESRVLPRSGEKNEKRIEKSGRVCVRERRITSQRDVCFFEGVVHDGIAPGQKPERSQRVCKVVG